MIRQTSNNPILSSYDIVAVVPKSEALLLKACQSSEVDIISMDFTQRLSFPVKINVVSQAIARGIYFEVPMAGVLGSFLIRSLASRLTKTLDTNSRKHVVANVAHLLSVTRGRNILLTSGTSNPLLLRNPFDLANLYVPINPHMICAELSTERACLGWKQQWPSPASAAMLGQ